ncbi:MAG: ornithine carbamoyltransferase [Chloroflexi bacterium]|nr:ornithine carbamoyltransferase [Chloroflexota bacterium]MYD48648.1 ornithine carbamoyltransferase [Chloroflexota bacterium]
MTAKRDFLTITDISAEETRQLINRAIELKAAAPGGVQPLAGKRVALLFEKPSLRTRVSFQIGIAELGGFSLYMSPEEVGLGKREPVSDVARVLSGYVDAVIARVNSHDSLVELAEYGSVPVINALSDVEHPCQTMADLLTITETHGHTDGLNLAYIGDGNNVARSLCLGAPAVGMNFAIAAPHGYQLEESVFGAASARGVRANDGPRPTVHPLVRPEDAVIDANVVYTDVWTSMGDEAETEQRLAAFRGYTVDYALMEMAAQGACFMHDMPAHYGEEVPPGMLEHPQSVAYQQAHNRLHAQKAVLEFLLA